MNRHKPLILTYIHKPPYPFDTGTNQRIRTLVQALREHYRVGLVIPHLEQPAKELTDLFDHIWVGEERSTTFDKIQSRLLTPLKKCWLWRRFNIKPSLTRNPLSLPHTSAAWRLWRVCRREKPALIFVQKIFNTVPATAIARQCGIPTLLDVHDLYTLGEPTLSRRFPNATSADEKALLQQYDALVAIQHEDANVLRQHLPGIPVATALHPVEIIHRNQVFRSFHTPSILFVGSAAAHNSSALDSFLTDYFPNITERFPDIRLDICGSVADTVDNSRSNVHFHGRVGDLSDYYAAATLVINPVLEGSGLKIKTVEALAHGKCLVTTPIGIEGLVNIKDSVVCVQPEHLAENIIRLLEKPDLIGFYEEKALEYAKKNLAKEVCYQELMLLIDQLITATDNP